MRNSSRRIFRGCRGFTLMEVLIALAVSSVVIVPLGASVAQLRSVSQSNTDNLIAIRNIDTAGEMLVQDFQSAQSPLPGGVTLSAGGSDTLTVVRSVASPSDSSTVYSISAAGDLERTVGGVTSTIASNISSVAYYVGSPVEIDVTATSGAVTITKTFDIISRIR